MFKLMFEMKSHSMSNQNIHTQPTGWCKFNLVYFGFSPRTGVINAAACLNTLSANWRKMALVLMEHPRNYGNLEVFDPNWYTGLLTV